MQELTLTKTSFTGGVWTGVLTGVYDQNEQPTLHLLRRGSVVATAELSADPENDSRRFVTLAVPAELLGDGVQSFPIVPEGKTVPLETIRLVAGEPLEQDLKAEIDALRAELDLLKSAFRRHCAETASQ